MSLDNRLEAVAAFVGSGCVADIGTDHGYLALELYRRDNSRKVIAADKNSGPCCAARKTFLGAGLGDVIEVRQGDGLTVLSAGEADTVCIAGMGGRLIVDILAAQPEVFGSLKSVVLQPQGGAAIVRRWLYEHAWHIADEALVEADGRLYQIILAQSGEEAMPTEQELLLGPVLVKKRPALFTAHVKSYLDERKKILAGIKQGTQPDAIRMARLEQEIIELEELLK